MDTLFLSRFAAGRQFLAEHGLNLLAVLPCAALPTAVTELLVDSGVPLADFSRLLLLGHGGRRLWEAAQTAVSSPIPDPIDTFSWEKTAVFLRDYLNSPPHFRLYPDTSYPVPLGRLGELAGWSQPSPLGIGISPVYGLWFAYRTAVLLDAPLPITVAEYGRRPCDSCEAKPCVGGCPATAVHPTQPIHFPACARHRLAPTSPCADQCLARLACPIAPQHRYTPQQISYHYRHSLHSLAQWAEGLGG